MDLPPDPRANDISRSPAAATGGRERVGTQQPLGVEPALDVPPSVLERYNARILDPATALRLPEQGPVRATVYIADRLLVSGAASFAARNTLTEVAGELGYRLEPPLVDPQAVERRTALASRAQLPEQHAFFTTSVQLIPNGDQPVPAPDAWTVLQTFRARGGRDTFAAQEVSLDHLLTSTLHTQGHPFVPRGPDGPFGGQPMSSYGLPGWGGRAPVAWMGRPPNRAEKLPGRRPVVAILDTGVGDHRWFRTSGVIRRNPTVDGVPMGLQDPAEDPELTGVITDPLEGPLDSDSGHGTFIAGLIHQLCPDADILSIRVMPSDGAVPEHVLLDALNLLALRQQLAQQPGGDPADLVDVVSLSLGYYHERPEDAAADPLLLQPLNALAESGAIIVAAAGNDATTRPLFPAAFAPDPEGIVTKADASRVPITAVGALNPDLTIALFSNAGPWVKVYRQGAALVSTFPETFNASAQPAYRLHAFDGWRETIDPDDFSGGFGTWSGTSFSAPVLAGEIAQQLLDGAYGPFGAVDPTGMVERGWRCVTAHTHLERPS